MKTLRRTSQAFTRWDAVVVIAAVVFLPIFIWSILASLARPKGSSRIGCVSNLKQVELGYRMWANDHGDQFPFQVSTNEGGTLELIGSADVYRHLQALSNELVSPKVLTCPTDSKAKATNWAQFNNANLGYFVGLDARVGVPATILSGDRNIVGGGTGRLRLWQAPKDGEQSTPEAGWDSSIHNGQGNLVLADGTAQQVQQTGLERQIRGALQATQSQVRFLIP